MTRAGAALAAVAALCLAGIGCSFLTASPAQVAAESFEAARRACALYEAQPASKHSKKADDTCAAVRAACDGSPAFATLGGSSDE